MLNKDRLNEKLNTNLFGKHMFCLEEIDSTNNEILKLAREGAPEGTVVCADYQTAGRGRRGRKWLAAPGQNLLFSLLLRPVREVDMSQKITLAAAVILAGAIEKYLTNYHNIEVNIRLKWPNDLLVKGKKVSGILAESILREKKIEALALGFGINVNTPAEAQPDKLKHSALSLTDLVKAPLDRESLLAEILNFAEKSYLVLERSNYKKVVPDWKKRCDQFGQRVRINIAGDIFDAQINDINHQGRLIYQTDDGQKHELIAGDVEKV